MIGARIYGGLGNQMFQYAAARSLSLSRSTPLWLDATWFERTDSTVTPRSFMLHHLNIDARVVKNPHRLPPVLGEEAAGSRRRLKRALFLGRTYTLVREPHEPPATDAPAGPDGCLLDGFWQDERYFAQHATTIREELSWRGKCSDETWGRYLLAVRQREAVALHVRRGDYVTDARTAAFHGALDITYYKRALEQLQEVVQSPTYFVFSDDLAWCRANLRFSRSAPVVFVESAWTHPFADIALMRECDHIIMANSSFSWWGAWLGDRAGRLVIAPEQWFVGAPRRSPVPDRWRRV